MSDRGRSVTDYPNTRSLRKALLRPVDEEKALSDCALSDSDEERTLSPSTSGDSHSHLDSSGSSLHSHSHHSLRSSHSHNNRNHSHNHNNKTEEMMKDDSDTNIDEQWDWVLTNFDVGTTIPQSISQELQRLQVLKSYIILDQDREDVFDRYTTMASRIFQVPIAVVSLVDLGRQWFMSTTGLGDVKETPRNVAFCAHAIQGRNDVLVVPETHEDPRFSQNPLVTGPPHIRFYAGAPLLSPEGYKLGTFCIIDSKPHPHGLTDDEKANLIDFAAMAMQAMVDRRNTMAKDDTAHLVACTAHDLLTPLMGVQLSLALLQEESESLTEAHRESLSNAIRSSDWLNRICQTTMETLRDTNQDGYSQNNNNNNNMNHNSPFIDMNEFVSSLNHTMESIPKRVPLVLTVDDSVPKRIVSDDLKLFRSSLNLLSNAFANTQAGSIRFHIRAEHPKKSLVFECTDTGHDLNLPQEDRGSLFKPNKKSAAANAGAIKDLGLYSVAYQIDSLGGTYGYRSRREEEGRGGSIFWFQVPFVLPDDISVVPSVRNNGYNSDDNVTMDDRLDPTEMHFAPGRLDLAASATWGEDLSRRLMPSSSHSVTSGRRYSNASDHNLMLNRAGLLAVQAAAAESSLKTSSSCCALTEIAKFKDIESFKAHKEQSRARSNSFTHLTGATDSSVASASCATRENEPFPCGMARAERGPSAQSVDKLAAAKGRLSRRQRNQHHSRTPSAGEDAVVDALLAAVQKNMVLANPHSPVFQRSLTAPSQVARTLTHPRMRVTRAKTQKKKPERTLSHDSVPFTIVISNSDENQAELDTFFEQNNRVFRKKVSCVNEEGSVTDNETQKPANQPLFSIAPPISPLPDNTPEKSLGPASLFDIAPPLSQSKTPEKEQAQPLFNIAPVRQTQGQDTNGGQALFSIAPAASQAKTPETEQAPALFSIAPTTSKTQDQPKKEGQGLFSIAPTSSAKPSGLFAIAPTSSTKPSLEPLQSKGQTPQETSSAPGARIKKALVIEDTVVVRKTLTRALQKRGYEVSQANDGVEGLEALKEEIFDMTLCDFLMPNMDGLDCVQQYRQWEQVNRPGIKQYIVGISAHVSHKDIEKGLEIGMNDFKPKPITMKTLQTLDESKEMEQVRAMLSKMCCGGSSGGEAGTNSPPQLRNSIHGTPKSDEAQSANQKRARSCLMATSTSSNNESVACAEKMRSSGWEVTIVHSGTSALEQLKTRNWGAVILDDDLPNLSGNQCVEAFRAWERQNRVNRQDNMFIVCTDVYLANPEACMLPPAGFDGAVGKQVSWERLQTLMAKQDASCQQSGMREGLSIVTR